jgi:hypothetical protein
MLLAKDFMQSSNQPPDITSFVIRFVHTPAAEEQTQAAYRGLIRHIQTNQEINFTHWSDAVAFIQNFVQLEDSSAGALDDPDGLAPADN